MWVVTKPGIAVLIRNLVDSPKAMGSKPVPSLNENSEVLCV